MLLEINCAFVIAGIFSKSTIELKLEAVEDGTKVTWTFISDAAYPHMRWLSVFMIKSMLEKSYKKGLAKLDSIIMNLSPVVEGYKDPTVIEVKSQTKLSIREVVKTEDIGPKMGEFYGLIYKYISENQLKPTEFPVAFWYDWSDAVSDMECAVFIEGDAAGTDLIKSSKSYEGKVVVLDYFGAYDSSPDGWQKIKDFILVESLEENGVPWDEYITDPGQETDTAKWLTKLYQPVK